MIKSQKGFTLLAIVFILVVLALAGNYLMKVSFGQVQAVNYSLLSTKAKFATMSAFELIKTTNQNHKLSCEDQSYHFGRDAAALAGFEVKLSCVQSLSYPKDNPTFMALQFKAKATRGHFGDREYVSYEQSRWFVQNTLNSNTE